MFKTNNTRLLEKQFVSGPGQPFSHDVHPSISDMRYGLTILIELAEAYDCQGYPLLYIANKHNFPLEELFSIVCRLEAVGLIESSSDKPGWVRLKDEPGERWVLEIVPVLKKTFSINL